MFLLLRGCMAHGTIVSLMLMLLLGALQVQAQGAGAQELIARVLLKADAAYSAKRYTQPEYNNAYDRYYAVLMLAPEHQHAKRGLRLILQRYIAMADGELENGSVQHAITFMHVIDEYYMRELVAAANDQANRFGLTAEDSHAVAALRARIAVLKKVPPQQDFNNLLTKAYVLDGDALKAKNSKMRKNLAQIAARVSQTNELVLIHARSDHEGRWIYQVLNAATPSYRVRGDIRITKKPAIHLQEPL